jgi:hypothetical protein
LGQTISNFNDGEGGYDITGESDGPFGGITFEESETWRDRRIWLNFTMEDKVKEAYDKLMNSNLSSLYKIELDEDDPTSILVITVSK